jgi:hypothetical protein
VSISSRKRRKSSFSWNGSVRFRASALISSVPGQIEVSDFADQKNTARFGARGAC